MNSVLDSSGRLPIGIRSGTTTCFGDFDQCLAISGRVNENTFVRGKFCFLNFRQTPSPSSDHKYMDKISNGICIPSLCSRIEVTKLLRKGIKLQNNFN